MSSHKPLALPHKVIYLVIAAICIMLGVAGLILPIIPGFLFMLGAVYCLSKVSHRFKNWADQQAILRDLQKKVSRINTVDVLSRGKVFALMTLDVMVRSVITIVDFLKRRVPRKKVS
ncbi:MAG: uncharacterized membrane protein YbaN (DUF454 family) [Flavobacterium sp.]|jgi:uncharacterized membrane protein YbaN (DUF454 family)